MMRSENDIDGPNCKNCTLVLKNCDQTLNHRVKVDLTRFERIAFLKLYIAKLYRTFAVIAYRNSLLLYN